MVSSLNILKLELPGWNLIWCVFARFRSCSLPTGVAANTSQNISPMPGWRRSRTSRATSSPLELARSFRRSCRSRCPVARPSKTWVLRLLIVTHYFVFDLDCSWTQQKVWSVETIWAWKMFVCLCFCASNLLTYTCLSSSDHCLRSWGDEESEHFRTDTDRHRVVQRHELRWVE